MDTLQSLLLCLHHAFAGHIVTFADDAQQGGHAPFGHALLEGNFYVTAFTFESPDSDYRLELAEPLRQYDARFSLQVEGDRLLLHGSDGAALILQGQMAQHKVSYYGIEQLLLNVLTPEGTALFEATGPHALFDEQDYPPSLRHTHAMALASRADDRGSLVVACQGLLHAPGHDFHGKATLYLGLDSEPSTLL